MIANPVSVVVHFAAYVQNTVLSCGSVGKIVVNTFATQLILTTECTCSLLLFQCLV
eukprot:m.373560 g.373560  ORF g.373560 m.373560 type:complete len:56 (+) comp20886_c0_seq8:321-488(+)